MPRVAEKPQGAERPLEAKKERKLEVVDTPKKLEEMRQRALASLTEAAQKVVDEGNLRLVHSVDAVGGREQDKIEGQRRLKLVQQESEELTIQAQNEIESEGAVPLATYEEQLGEIKEIGEKEKLEKQVAEAWEWYLAEPGKAEEKKPEEIMAGRGYSGAQILTAKEAKMFELKKKMADLIKKEEPAETKAMHIRSGAEILTADESARLETQFKNKNLENQFDSNLKYLENARIEFANLDRFNRKKNTPEWRAARQNYILGLQKRRELLFNLKKSELDELKADSQEAWKKLGFGQEIEFEDLQLSKKEFIAKYKKEHPGLNPELYYKKLKEGSREIAKLGFNAEFDYDKELLKQMAEIKTATSLEEGIRLTDLKTKLRLEEQGKSKFEKFKDFAFKAVDKYRKMSLRNKLLVSGALLGGGLAAGFVGGATGAAMLTGVVTGRLIQRAFGGGATFLGLEGLIKRAQEKDLKKKTLERAKNLEADILNKNPELDEELFKLEGTRKKQEYWRYGLAGTAGFLVGSGLVGKALHNVYEGLVQRMYVPTTMAEKMPTGAAKGVGVAKAEHISPVEEVHKEAKHLKGHGRHISEYRRLYNVQETPKKFMAQARVMTPEEYRKFYQGDQESPMKMPRSKAFPIEGPAGGVKPVEAPVGVRVEPKIPKVPPEAFRVPTPETHPISPPSHPEVPPPHPVQPPPPPHTEVPPPHPVQSPPPHPEPPPPQGPPRPHGMSDSDYEKYKKVMAGRQSGARAAARKSGVKLPPAKTVEGPRVVPGP